MTDRRRAVAAYQDALVRGGHAEPVARYLADDVVIETNFGRAEGIEQALALLREPRQAGLLEAGPSWSEAVTAGDRVTVTATLPASEPFGGLECVLFFAGEKIRRVEQQTLPALPPAPARLKLTREIKDAVNDALANETPMLIAYRTAEGEIHVSYRGTVQAHSDSELALWARDASGGLPRNIVTSPRVTLFYHDPKSRTTYTFYGRARLEPAPKARAAIYEKSHPRERQMDFRRRGVAIVVELDKVEGRAAAGQILMLRR